MDTETERGEAHFQPSSNRLKRAKEHGMLPYSSPLAAAVHFLGSVIGLFLLASQLGNELLEWTRQIWSFRSNPQTLGLNGLWPTADWLPESILILLLFFFVSQLAAHGLQKGMTIPQRQLLDISNLMPFRRRPSKTWGEHVWTNSLRIFQVAALGLIAYFFLSHAGRQWLKLWDAGPHDLVPQATHFILSFAMVFALGFLFLALPDYAWQHLLHRRRLMMNEQELKEENRTEEGNPHLRGAQKSFHRHLLERRS